MRHSLLIRDDEERPLSTTCQTVQAIQAVQAVFWSFDRLVFVPPSFDWNCMVSLTFNAFAIFISVSIFAFWNPPLSSRERAGCFVPMRRASSSCVSPASSRDLITGRESVRPFLVGGERQRSGRANSERASARIIRQSFNASFPVVLSADSPGYLTSTA